jgi:hypothetical protein
MKIKIIPETVRSLLSKVAQRKEGAVEYVRRKCDDIPPQKRFRIVAVAFVLFALLALFVFGKSMYNIYNGVHSNPDFGNIKQMPMPDKGDSPAINDFYGSEEPVEKTDAPLYGGGAQDAN